MTVTPIGARALLMPVLCVAWATGLSAEDKLMSVDWTDPAIATFVREKTENPRRSLGPEADSALEKIKLPVLGFYDTPGVAQNTFRAGPKPETERTVTTDADNPVWYQITEHYGDVTVTVEADLRVQHTVGDDYEVYGSTRRGAMPSAADEISVFDAEAEEGMEGAIAEYVVNRFGIPYTVKIECSLAAKEQCQDKAQILKDAEALTLIEANPPK